MLIAPNRRNFTFSVVCSQIKFPFGWIDFFIYYLKVLEKVL